MKKTELQETLYQTSDYDAFTMVLGNRPIKPKHVARLAKRMRTEGFLQDQAIDVDPALAILDGQHRLLAAKEADVPVTYRVIATPVTISGIQGRNIQLPWTTNDFLQSHIARGDKRYIQLKAFADEYRLSVAISFRILSGMVADHGRSVLAEIRADEFEIKDLPRAERLASLVSGVRNYSPDLAFTDSDCVRALDILMNKTDPKELFAQLQRYQQVITRRRAVKDYLLQFENILNQGRTGTQISLM